MKKDLKKISDKIFYNFCDEKLLVEALTHPSLSKDTQVQSNYQRLEFLGDKVLSLVIASFLMKKYPNETEGHLSRRQAMLVSGETLSKIALEIGLEEFLQISVGEKKLGGKTNKRNLENALEAIIGAIYLDSNYENAKEFVMRFWDNYLNQNLSPPKDPVSELQEIVQLQSRQLPQYSTKKSGGSDHSPNFISTVKILHLGLEFSASGKSKKSAQKAVAKVALGYFNLS